MTILLHEKHDWQWFVAWETLARLEPRLLDAEQTLLGALSLPPGEFGPMIRGVRQQAARLVGWASGRRHSVLSSSAAYHSALAHLIALAERREVVR